MKPGISFSFILAGILFIAAGCGYRFEGPSNIAERQTISVPYVPGDIDGQLTNELVRQLTASGLFEYVQSGGDLILQVVITGDGSDKIGYRYDTDSTTGKLETNLIPTESRRSMSALVTLIDGATKEILIGPSAVLASSDYDYVNSKSIRDLTFIGPGGILIPVIPFSLGQLDSIEGAQDDTVVPLFRHMSQKIVDGIINKKW